MVFEPVSFDLKLARLVEISDIEDSGYTSAKQVYTVLKSLFMTLEESARLRKESKAHSD